MRFSWSMEVMVLTYMSACLSVCLSVYESAYLSVSLSSPLPGACAIKLYYIATITQIPQTPV